MSFFYDLNKKLDSIRATPEVTHKQLNERDEGKPGKNFEKIAKNAAERYGSKAAGERVAGAVRNKLKAQGKLEEEGMSRAAKGYEKYGKEGMEALAKAGREGKALDPVRAKYDKYDNTEVDEGQMLDKFVNSKIGQKILGKPSDANKLSPSTAGHSFGKGQVTPGGPLGQIARSNMNKNEGAHSQDAMKLNPDFDKIGKKPGVMGKIAQGVKKVADFVAPGDEDLLRDLERKSGGRRPTKEAAAPIDFDKVLDAIAALYGDDMWENDAMQDLANDLAQAGPTDRELDFIIAKGRLPKRLANTQFSAGDNVQFGEASSPMTAKQKSFAALAEPKDKITFADKIAGAKKEVDEMLGDVAAEAMKKALGGGKGRNAEMDEASQDNAFTAHKRARAETPKVGTITHGSKHDVEEIPGGRRVTRRTDAQGISVGADDDKPADGEKRGRGRPKGPEKAPERVTGGATRHKGGRKMTKEAGGMKQTFAILDDTLIDQISAMNGAEVDPDAGSVETYDENTARQLIAFAQKNPQRLKRTQTMNTAGMKPMAQRVGGTATGPEYGLKEGEVSTGNLQQMWKLVTGLKTFVQDPDGKALLKELTGMVKHYMNQDEEKMQEASFPVPPGYPAFKKKKPAPSVPPTKDNKDDKHDEKKDEVKEDEPKKSKSKFTFGGGIYDSINRDLENMIAESMTRLDESMSINMSMNNDEHGGPTRSLTVTATDDDAMKLSQLLKSAGLGGGDEGYGGSGYKSACGCGTPDCSCGEQQMDEVSMNQPDYPTNTETSNDALQYSGGLNKPKSTGQTTVPVIASQEERQESYAAEEEDAIKRMMEMAGVKKKAVDEEKTDEGNLFTKGLADDNVKVGDKIPGTNAVKKKDIDESIFAMTANLWKTYKG